MTLLTRTETAERLTLSHMTLRRLGKAGLLDEIRIIGRVVRITEESVDRYLADRTAERITTERSAAA